MITQEIEPYKEEHVYKYQPWVAPTRMHGRYPYGNVEYDNPKIPDFTMGKLEYAAYLQRLKTKVGDLVVTHYQNKPYLAAVVLRVKDIMEIHKHVEFCQDSIGPKCLVLQNVKGEVQTWYGGANLYHSIPEADYPSEWLAVLEKEKHANSGD